MARPSDPLRPTKSAWPRPSIQTPSRVFAGAPQSQINIGKSIFYNERINTTGSGLVQVLLVDGSTFTVGPGSNLVIDKFVYDPKKGTGQIAASFSKGVMRFVGGKISKNEGGVTVGTPAGALAIRGGIAYADFKSPKNFSVLFVFGDYIKLQGQTVWQPGYGLFSNNGVVTNRPFNATDLAGIMAALTNSNTTGLANNSDNGPKPGTTARQYPEPEPADLRRKHAAGHRPGGELAHSTHAQLRGAGELSAHSTHAHLRGAGELSPTPPHANQCARSRPARRLYVL